MQGKGFRYGVTEYEYMRSFIFLHPHLKIVSNQRVIDPYNLVVNLV